MLDYNKEMVFEIVRRMQSDNSIEARLLQCDTREKMDEYLGELAKEGLIADNENIAVAIDVMSIMKKLKMTTSDGRSIGTKVNSQQQRPMDEDVLSKALREGLLKVIKQIDEGYRRVMDMYLIAFFLGIFLVLVSAIASLVYHSDYSSLVLGGLGMADIITVLIFKPTESLQKSRASLAQLQAAFAYWVNDVHNLNIYIQRIMENEQEPTFKQVCDVSDTLCNKTERMMHMIRLYCITDSPALDKRFAETSEQATGSANRQA